MKEKPVNKWSLYKNSMFGVVIFGVCAGLFLFILLQTVTLFSSNPTYGWRDSIALGCLREDMDSYCCSQFSH